MFVTHNCYILIRGNTLGEITEEALHYAYGGYLLHSGGYDMLCSPPELDPRDHKM